MSTKSDRPRWSWSAPVVLGVALLLTAAVTRLVFRMEESKDRLRFQNSVQRTQDSLKKRLDDDIAMLQGAVGLFAASSSVNRAAFHAYAQQLRLTERYAGIQGIGFSARVRPEERAALAARLRREGEGSFQLWPSGARPEYHAILYLEPRNRRNQKAIGYDMFSEPRRRAAMEKARDTGRAAASAPVTLVQEIDREKQPGFLIYVPVYRRAPGGGEGGGMSRKRDMSPRTAAERRQALVGFVYSPFRAYDFLNGIFGSESHPRVHFQIFDGPTIALPNLLCSSDAAAAARTRTRPLASPASVSPPSPLQGRFVRSARLSVAGRPWTILFATTPEFELTSSSDLVPLTLLGGLLISALLFGITLFQGRAREAAERSAAELRRSEAARREGEEQLRLITDAAPALICYVDAEERYRFNNGAYERWFHRSRAEVRGRPLREVLGEKAYALIRPHVQAALAGDAVSYEGPLMCPDCGVRHVSASYVPHMSPEGRVLGFIALISDISERRETELDNARLYREAEEARAAAETANRLKDEFLATLSHELRTPLNAILGYSQLLRRGSRSEEELARGLEAIERGVNAQTQLIDDLLDVSRVISGKLRLDIQPVDPAAVIEAAIEAVAPAAAAREIHLERAIDPNVGPVPADAGRLQQVVWNLLSNAIKFTPPGGRVTVGCRVGQSGPTPYTPHPTPYAEITVTDTGRGIDPSFLPHVFDRFRQEDSTTTRQHGGLGLGLAIVRHLVELHGGSVRAESDGLGHGARFIVTLPLSSTRQVGERGGEGKGESEKAAGIDPSVSPSPPHSLTSSLPHPPLRLDGVRVLVVEDEPDARELIERILSECGAVVRAEAAAEPAERALAEFSPHVLVSDIGMPDMDGFALIRRIRSLPPEQGGRVPAAALTAFAGSEDRRRALLAGFHVHVPKPIDADDLVAVVARLAGRWENEERQEG